MSNHALPNWLEGSRNERLGELYTQLASAPPESEWDKAERYLRSFPCTWEQTVFLGSFLASVKGQQAGDCRPLLVRSQRRAGKTTSIGMFVAGYLLATKDATVTVYSPSAHRSEELAKYVEDQLEWLAVLHGVECRQDKQGIKLQVWVDGNKRVAWLVPAQLSRGTGSGVILMDEFPNFPIGFVGAVLLPLLGMREKVVVGCGSGEWADSAMSVIADLFDVADVPLGEANL